MNLKVISCNTVVEKARSDSSKIRIAECLVGDKTGSVLLTARNGEFYFMDLCNFSPSFFLLFAVDDLQNIFFVVFLHVLSKNNWILPQNKLRWCNQEEP